VPILLLIEKKQGGGKREKNQTQKKKGVREKDQECERDSWWTRGKEEAAFAQAGEKVQGGTCVLIQRSQSAKRAILRERKKKTAAETCSGYPG